MNGVAGSGAVGVAGRCAFRKARKLSCIGLAVAESHRLLSSVPEGSEGGESGGYVVESDAVVRASKSEYVLGSGDRCPQFTPSETLGGQTWRVSHLQNRISRPTVEW